jgi:hypothetical protein
MKDPWDACRNYVYHTLEEQIDLCCFGQTNCANDVLAFRVKENELLISISVEEALYLTLKPPKKRPLVRN